MAFYKNGTVLRKIPRGITKIPLKTEKHKQKSQLLLQIFKLCCKTIAGHACRLAMISEGRKICTH